MNLPRSLSLALAIAVAPVTPMMAAQSLEPDSGESAGPTPQETKLLDMLAPPTIANPTTITVEQARAGINARPRNADAWHQLGESLAVAGQLEEAVKAYERATHLPPRVIGRAYLYRDLAESRENLGDLDGALTAMRVSLRTWPISRDGIFCSGFEEQLMLRLLVKKHDMQAAKDFYRPLYEAHPDWVGCREIYQALTGE